MLFFFSERILFPLDLQKNSQKYIFFYFSTGMLNLLPVFNVIAFLFKKTKWLLFAMGFVAKKTQMPFKNLNVVFLTQCALLAAARIIHFFEELCFVKLNQ
jgi:hypothetical protein